MEEKNITIENFKNKVCQDFNIDFDESSINSLLNILNLNYFTERKDGESVSVGESNNYEIVKLDNQEIIIGNYLAMH